VADFNVIPVTAPTQVSSIIEKFCARYRDDGVKLYSRLDVAVVAQAR
jgi:hypothetical protein